MIQTNMRRREKVVTALILVVILWCLLTWVGILPEHTTHWANPHRWDYALLIGGILLLVLILI